MIFFFFSLCFELMMMSGFFKWVCTQGEGAICVKFKAFLNFYSEVH